MLTESCCYSSKLASIPPFQISEPPFDLLGVGPFTPQLTPTDQARSTKRYVMPPGQREELTALYAKDVTALSARHPHLDLDLWPTSQEGVDS